MLYSVAEQLRTLGKPAFVYYFGDSDPSGVDIDRVAERDVRQFAGDVEIHFRRVAVTPEQITEWSLPTRPTKRTDSRSRAFDGESVELDAIPPGQLRALVQECIEQHIDRRTLEETLRIENLERERLADIAEWSRT